jgi:GntP family gluconate:H+ symporter
MRVAIPALAGLSVLHGLIPPHPGPLIAISAVHAQLGTTLALGILVGLPTVAICGPLLSILITRWVPVGAPSLAGGVDTTAATARSADVRRPPSFLMTLLTILFPVLLMLGKALADIIWTDTKHPPLVRTVFDFIGEPLVAMTLAVLLAMVTFGYAVGFTGSRIGARIGASVGPIAAVMLIVGAGGGFKQTLIGAGVGDSVAKFATGSHLSVLVLGYLVAVALRLATGSATVATITAAGISAAGRHTEPHPHRAARPGHRHRITVPVARERRGFLAGQGTVRADGRPDLPQLVGDGNRGLGGRLRVRHAGVRTDLKRAG